MQVNLGDLDPEAVRLELYADGAMGGDPTRQEMQRVGPVAGTAGGFVYRAVVSAARPVTDYTARVIPHRDGVVTPLEDAHILWQR